jgi:predicted RNA-binding Zn ribbon-like protein
MPIQWLLMTDRHDAPPEPESEGELFLDFANTLHFSGGIPDDHVGDGARLHAWLRDRALLSGRTPVARLAEELAAFHEVRELVRDITIRRAEGRLPSTAQVRRLNTVLREGVHYHRLAHDREGGRFTVGQVGGEVEQARAAIAGSLAHYLADHDADRLRVCDNAGCRWLFVDRSRTGRKRWCDMRTCGNRAKVARHRARQRTAVGQAASIRRRSGARRS